MRWAIPLLVGAVLTGTALGQPTVHLDLALVVANQSARLFDHFDDGMLDADWVTMGSPGPESGTTLEMDAGDFIFQPLLISSRANWLSVATIDLTDFSEPTDAVFLLMTGRAGDRLGLAITPQAAFVFDENGLLGGRLLNPGPRATLVLLHGGRTGRILAAVNSRTVFLGDPDFDLVTGIGIGVVPEPAGLLLFAVAALAAVRRRGSAPGRSVGLHFS